MKCFYHNDLDGNAAAFCVYAWVGIKSITKVSDVSFIEINYGTKFPFEKIKKNEQIWIVDYSISPDEMRKLLKITQDVTWIDHHKTAIEKYADFEFPIRGIRKDGEAACVLTWKYIHWWTGRGEGKEDFTKENIHIPVAKCILLVGDRDVWKWEHKETRSFFNGSQLHDTSPSSNFWWKCMDHEVEPLPLPNNGNATAQKRGIKFWNKLLLSGEIIQKYKNQGDSGINKSLGWITNFEGFSCFAINRGRVSSDRLGNNMDDYDICLRDYHDGKQFTVSLYTKKDIDCSNIAKKYGGGGHKKAAGFQCKELPFVKGIK